MTVLMKYRQAASKSQEGVEPLIIGFADRSLAMKVKIPATRQRDEHSHAVHWNDVFNIQHEVLITQSSYCCSETVRPKY